MLFTRVTTLNVFRLKHLIYKECPDTFCRHLKTHCFQQAFSSP